MTTDRIIAAPSIDRLLDEAFGPMTPTEQTALDEILTADRERRQRIQAACGATLLIGRAMYGTRLGEVNR